MIECLRSATVALVVATSTATGVLGVGGAAAATCPPVSAADTSTASGWIGYLTAHPDDYGLMVTHGDRVTLSHNANRRYPAASAAKLIDLAAYSQAVALHRVSPTQTVSVNEWERWYLPIDDGAHIKALEYLKLPLLQGIPGEARPGSLRVSFGQLADVMIRFSDSAAADTLRAALGDARLESVMHRYGMTGTPPLYAGLYLSLADSTLTTEARQQVAGRRYHDDRLYRTSSFSTVTTVPLKPTAQQVDNTYSLTTLGLNALMRGLASGTFGPGSREARAILEFLGARPDGSVLGLKGGALGVDANSVLTENFELRSPSGSVATATLMVHRLSRADFDKSNFAQQTLLGRSMTDPDTVLALQCGIGTRVQPH